MDGNKLIVDVNSLSGGILDRYNVGFQAGYEIGFKSTEKKITIKRGFYSMWYGVPGAGKTRFILQMCVYLAKKHGLKFALYSKEEGLPEDLIILLVQMWTGKPFYKGDYNVDRLTEAEVAMAMQEVAQYFFPFGGRINGFQDLCDAVDEAQREVGEEFFGIVADPLNTLVTASGNIAGMYEEGLDILLDYLQKTQKHCFMGTHPSNPKDTTKEDKHGNIVLRPVNPWELKGGQTLWGKGYLMVSMYRHRKTEINNLDPELEIGENFKGNEVTLIVQKAKPEGVGEADSEILLRYDKSRYSYYEKLDKNTVFFPNLEHVTEETKIKDYVQMPLQRNESFDDECPF